MNFFKNIKLGRKISILSISFIIFLTIIGFVSIKQLTNVNSKVMELNNSRLIPIVTLENMKSEVEYIPSKGNSFIDATDESSRKAIEEDMAAHVADLDKALAQYKNNSEFKPCFKITQLIWPLKTHFLIMKLIKA
jgi:methyl-accepting chemotaxis protein